MQTTSSAPMFVYRQLRVTRALQLLETMSQLFMQFATFDTGRAFHCYLIRMQPSDIVICCIRLRDRLTSLPRDKVT